MRSGSCSQSVTVFLSSSSSSSSTVVFEFHPFFFFLYLCVFTIEKSKWEETDDDEDDGLERPLRKRNWQRCVYIIQSVSVLYISYAMGRALYLCELAMSGSSSTPANRVHEYSTLSEKRRELASRLFMTVKTFNFFLLLLLLLLLLLVFFSSSSLFGWALRSPLIYTYKYSHPRNKSKYYSLYYILFPPPYNHMKWDRIYLAAWHSEIDLKPRNFPAF
jgi:hypothetical protein